MKHEEIIFRKLIDLGIPANLLGYRYLKLALSKALENPSILDSMTKGLYPAIAVEERTTSSRVERAIRHAIEVGFSRGNILTLTEMFGYTANANIGKVTNSEFIATLAEYIRMEQKQAG